MPKLRKLTREELMKTHLSLVREIGRIIGVKAPSAQPSKEKLVDMILQVQNGEVEPVKRSKGAKPKIKVDISAFYEPEENDKTDDTSDLTEEEKDLILRGSKVYPDEHGNMPDADEFYKSVARSNKRFIFRDSEQLSDDCFEAEGVLEQHASGYGFLRASNYENSDKDVFVSMQNIKRYNLRRGDKVKGTAKMTREGNSAALQTVISVNGMDPSEVLRRKNFDSLIPYYPTERIKLETESTGEDLAIRCVDLFAPIGKGQRGLIVAPPKTGKTTLLKKIAQSIESNYPDIKLIMLLIDERPEEVTDMKRSIKGEVVFSTFDENPDHHIRAAELVINRAKRLVEDDRDVVILMDSITRLARAYNTVIESSGKVLSGGLDPMAMTGPKRFFGAARNIENGGSLTILSTALIETGSRMDDVIYEEFKGTGNMEIHLSRELSEKRIFPAIDLYKSGTRKDELLLSSRELSCVYKLRKILAERDDATDSLLEMIKKTSNNEDLLNKVDVWLKLYQK